MSMMNILRHKCLVFTILLSLIGTTQTHYVIQTDRVTKFPCTRPVGVEWVRDPNSCNHYFICVSGRPVKMPPCPKEHVWSSAGRNCVPEASRWNDCSTELLQRYLEQRQQEPNVDVVRLNDGDDTTKNDSFSATSDRMDALVNLLDPVQVRLDNIKGVYPNHPCVFTRDEVLLPHPKYCHWFYNCSLNPRSDEWAKHEALTRECPYPQLFSLTTRECENYTEVDCGSRNVQKEPCSYRNNVCTKAHCRPCSIRFASCLGKQDGNHTFAMREWTPRYIMCKDERTIRQHDCSKKTPIFSPLSKNCETLHNIPKQHGGLQPICIGRHDGFHPDEAGRCEFSFECRDSKFLDFNTCGKGRLFDPRMRSCKTGGVAPPCGSDTVSLCSGYKDGMYADPYGRCPMYYHCKAERLLGYLKCPFGSFSPKTGRCEMKSNIPAPCGKEVNPCYKKFDGIYPDLKENCMSYFRCRGNYTVLQRTCANGLVFNHISGECEDANVTPPPCGMAPNCFNRKDGRYASPLLGCQFYYTCIDEHFQGYERCSLATGGFYFNPSTQKCDFPKNICGPCGSKRVNCNSFSAYGL